MGMGMKVMCTEMYGVKKEAKTSESEKDWKMINCDSWAFLISSSH